MTLIKCKECNAQISYSASACPACGLKATQPTSRLAIGIAGLFAIFLAKGIFDSNTAPEPPVKSAAQVAESIKEDQEFQHVLLAAKLLKQGMKNPDAFKLASAVMLKDGTICFEYRSTNSFNAIVPGTFALTPDKGSANEKDWHKYCAGKAGTNYTSVRQAL